MRLALRIYYEDTDFSGFVYHARYLHFFERGRTEALRGCGIDQRALFELQDGPQSFVVRRLQIDYLAPARMDDWVEVETRIVKIGGASLEMSQRLLRQGQILATAQVSVVFLVSGRAKRLPQNMRMRLTELQACAPNPEN